MSAQGYYNQGAPQYPPQSYGPPQGQYGAPPPQQQMYYGPPQGGYQQPPPQQQPEKKDRGCLMACLATLCCCFVCEEGCECCIDCCECLL